MKKIIWCSLTSVIISVIVWYIILMIITPTDSIDFILAAALTISLQLSIITGLLISKK